MKTYADKTLGSYRSARFYHLHDLRRVRASERIGTQSPTNATKERKGIQRELRQCAGLRHLPSEHYEHAPELSDHRGRSVMKKYYLFEVYVNGRRTGTYRDKLTADREASGAMMGTTDTVEVRKVQRLPGPSFDDAGNTIIIDARGYGRRVK